MWNVALEGWKKMFTSFWVLMVESANPESAIIGFRPSIWWASSLSPLSDLLVPYELEWGEGYLLLESKGGH